MSAPLRLVPITEDGSPAEPVARLPDAARDVLPGMAGLYRHAGHAPPWIGYLAFEGDTCVGTCAFKTPPADGRVELAYFTFPGHEGRGVATRMAAALVDMAQRTDPALRLVAQTLPQEGASTRVLTKLGFARTGTVEHPEDGTVWQWELPPDDSSSPRRTVSSAPLERASTIDPLHVLRFIARPAEPPRADTDVAGAYVNCWIVATDRADAERRARELIAADGWTIEALEEHHELDSNSPPDNPYIEQARIDGEVLVFHTWPRSGEHEDEGGLSG